MSKILVTGGAGFIGSHLIENLLKDKRKVICIDNFNDYYAPSTKEKNINELINLKNCLKLDDSYFKLYRGDIRNYSLIKTVFDENNIDIVVHLAAMTGVRHSLEIPEEYLSVNITGTLTLLEACKRKNVSKFILASSSSVYGNNYKVPFSEDDPVDKPISPYAVSKKSAELLCYTYYKLNEISIACLRFFSVYGPKQRPDLAIHKFTKLILDNKEIPFYGDGHTRRDYTYIDDIIDGILMTINWINNDENMFEIFNLGESRTVSLKQVVQSLEKSLNKKANLNKLPLPPGDVSETFADISKSKKILGYNPQVSFEEGIERFIKWYLNEEIPL